MVGVDPAAQGLCPHVRPLASSHPIRAKADHFLPTSFLPSSPTSLHLLNLYSAVTTAGFIISADKSAREYELSKYKIGSGTQLEQIAHRDQKLEQEAGIAGTKKAVAPHSTSEAVIEWAKENRWTAVGVSYVFFAFPPSFFPFLHVDLILLRSWAASMVGSGAYIASSPLSFAQKLVQVRLPPPSLRLALFANSSFPQARMIAQALTVGVLIASAALTQIPNAAGVSDDQIKREAREDSMYAWKNKDHGHKEVKTA